ncbi:MAG: quinone oxidoreductase family protein [Solirubrobacterales bacterium]
MLAARFHDFKAPPVVEELEEPRAAEGESLVEVAAAAITHLDLTVASGEFPRAPSLPYVGGAEGAGRILESASFDSGTPVRVHGAGVGVVRDGVWAKRIAVPDAALAPVPAGTSLNVAATYFTTALTAHAAIHEVGGMADGERVAVLGAAGAIGAMAARLAQRDGAGQVIGVARSRERAAAIPDGIHAVALSAPGAREEIRGPEGVDLLVDTLGGPHLDAILASAMRPGSRVVLVGYTTGTTLSVELPALMAADVALLPMNLPNRLPAIEQHAEEMLGLVETGELPLELSPVPFAELPQAVADLGEQGAVGRLVAELG